MLNYRKFAVCGLLCLIFQQVFSQDGDYTSYRLRVESGGTVPFNINSLKKYNEGVEYLYWTQITIYFSDFSISGTDTIMSGATWKLEFKANTNELLGDYGGKLDLDFITVEVVDGGGEIELAPPFINTSQFTLSENYQTLIDNVEPQGYFNKYKILITYSIGKGFEKLLGNPPDFYTVDIFFDLSKVD